MMDLAKSDGSTETSPGRFEADRPYMSPSAGSLGSRSPKCPSPSPPLSCNTPDSGCRRGNAAGSSEEEDEDDDISDGAVSGDGDPDLADSVHHRFQSAVISAVRNQLEVEAEKELLRKLAEATGAASRGGAALPAQAKWAKGAGRPMEATTRRLAACFERAVQDAMEARSPPSAAADARSGAACGDASGSPGTGEGPGAVRARLVQLFNGTALGDALGSVRREAGHGERRDGAAGDSQAFAHGYLKSPAQEEPKGGVAGHNQVSCLSKFIWVGV